MIEKWLPRYNAKYSIEFCFAQVIFTLKNSWCGSVISAMVTPNDHVSIAIPYESKIRLLINSGAL